MARRDSERAVEEQILGAAKWLGLFAVKNQVERGVFRAVTGLGEGSADIFMIDPVMGGRAIFVEVKKPGEKPTKKQIEFRDEVLKFKAAWFLCTSAPNFVDRVRGERNRWQLERRSA